MSSTGAPKAIVVGTDFSPASETALAWAAELAREHGAGILLVHALSANVLPAPEFVPLPPECVETMHGDAKRLLEETAARTRALGVDVECELLLSWPSIGILDVADRFSADLIVVGTRGRSPWKRALLGSTAARVVRQAQCPVLTVRHQEPAEEPQLVRTILVPTDFSHGAEAAAAAAVRLLGEGPKRKLVLAHAFRVPLEAAHLPARVLSDAIRDTELAASDALQSASEQLRRPGLRIELVAREGDPAEMILALAKREHADMIAMGTHGRSGLARLLLGSTAEHVLSSATCPVLTVHDAPAADPVAQ